MPKGSAASAPTGIAPAERARLVKAASYASVSTAVVLAAVKAWAWGQTGSVSLLASLADSLLDFLSSLLTFWAVRFSLSPPDAEHRFGHGKSEGLAALLQACVITVSGLYVCYEAVQRFLAPAPVTRAGLGVAVIVFSVFMTLSLVLFQRRVSARTGSIAIAADAMHYKTDLAVNASVIAALGMTALTGWGLLDPAVGLGVGLYILWGSWSIASHSLEILLDREIPDEDREKIRRIALAHPRVLGFHDMRTRHGGANYIVQFHLELEPRTRLTEAHVILDEVEDQVRAAYPGCEIIIHPDPLGFAERRDEFGREAGETEAAPGAEAAQDVAAPAEAPAALRPAGRGR